MLHTHCVTNILCPPASIYFRFLWHIEQPPREQGFLSGSRSPAPDVLDVGHVVHEADQIRHPITNCG